jgi:hypothetical protein
MGMDRAEKISSSNQPEIVWRPESESEKQFVLAQMEKLLSDSHFRSSKRYPMLLRYVVEQTLAGNEDSLKERTLGVEVFHRTPDYDTSLDSVVRLSAGEVRKRIAQYYQSPDHQKELKIELNPGSYVPVFCWPTEDSEETTPNLAASPAGFASGSQGWKHRAAYWLVGVLAAGILLTAGVLHWKHSREPSRRSVFEEVWSPLLDSNRNILICLGESNLQTSSEKTLDLDRPDNDSVVEAFADKRDFVPFPDVQSLSRFISLLGKRGHGFSVQSSRSTDYSQLREKPVLLIGAFNNRWTLNRTAALRFRFAGLNSEDKTIWIEDAQHPNSHEWQINSGDPRSKVGKDYGIVARFTDDATGQVVMISAGLAGSGTKAAGEFLTDEKSLEQLAINAPPGWEHKNFEAVVSSQVIDGMQGKPKVVAKVFW